MFILPIRNTIDGLVFSAEMHSLVGGCCRTSWRTTKKVSLRVKVTRNGRPEMAFWLRSWTSAALPLARKRLPRTNRGKALIVTCRGVSCPGSNRLPTRIVKTFSGCL